MHEHRWIPGLLEDQPRAEMERQPHTPFKARVMANGRGHVEDVIRSQLLGMDHGLEGGSEGIRRVHNSLRLTGRAGREAQGCDLIRAWAQPVERGPGRRLLGAAGEEPRPREPAVKVVEETVYDDEVLERWRSWSSSAYIAG